MRGVGVSEGEGVAGRGEVPPMAPSHQFPAFPCRRVREFLLISSAINQPQANFCYLKSSFRRENNSRKLQVRAKKLAHRNIMYKREVFTVLFHLGVSFKKFDVKKLTLPCVMRISTFSSKETRRKTK